MLPWFANNVCPLFLAPMAGHTDSVYRSLCRGLGADVVVTEFVQAEPLVRGVERTWQTIDFEAGQRPLGVQIFGAQPARMALAAQLLAERLRPDFVDLNFGCPAINVVEHDAGAALLKQPALLREIAVAVAGAVAGIPVTAKMRIGWDGAGVAAGVATDIARRLEDAGMRALAVHGRTREQGYSGEADWDEIGRVAAAVKIPVVGNGDIRDGATAVRRFRESGVRGLMIGRGALGNPWVFAEIKAALRGETPPPGPSAETRWALLCQYARELERRHIEAGGDGADMRWMLAKLHPLTQGLPGARQFRARASAWRRLDDILACGEKELFLARKE